MKHTFLKTTFILIFSILFAGCAINKDNFIPVGEPLNQAESKTAIERLLLTKTDVRTFKTLARTQVLSGDSSQSFRYLIALNAPRDIRIEVLPLNTAYALSIFTSSNNKAAFVDTVEKKVYEGTSAEDFLKLFLKLPISDQDLLPFLLGRIPNRFFNSTEFKVYNSTTPGKLIAQYGNSIYRWEIDNATNLPSKIAIKDPFKGEVLVNGTYGEFQKNNYDNKEILIPSTIELFLPQDDVKIIMKMGNVQLNTQIKEGTFEYKIPSGFEVESN